MPVDWQRHYVGLRALLEAGGTLEELLPGVTWRGDDMDAGRQGNSRTGTGSTTNSSAA
ncbi:hypothetical protein [Streptomyces sp. A5-4]|uniref:hypothetical protein n=1 Tax=Streptomyces sp. A5-4 TaxID=3384771 RepID=UPI003DA8F69D